MKCRPSLDGGRCDRCTRKSLTCVFEKHKRGRKPGVRLARPSSSAFHNTSEPVDRISLSRDEFEDRPDEASSAQPDSRLWSEGLQPSRLLNDGAMNGSFSLQNILSAIKSSSSRAEAGPDKTPVEADLVLDDDPIQHGIVNMAIARSLFESFMNKLNPFINQFDPVLHTFAYIRRRSPFLMSSILAAAAKAFNPSLHLDLRAHTETLMARSFSKGVKSIEAVQAIMVSTYWKEPDDSRAWLSIGYAIRICFELGWHNLGTDAFNGPNSQTELERREVRSMERTWLVLFVYDRSISLQMGKPWMIDQTALIESVASWHKHDLAVPSNDVLLCAFVSLRLVGTRTIDYFNLHRQPRSRNILSAIQTTPRLLNRDIDHWQKDWLALFDGMDYVEPCHRFLVRFYGTHLRLVSSSVPLFICLDAGDTEGTTARQAIWACFTTATEMLALVADSEISHLLYFAQDSIHVMTAYAAVLLIKLLLSLPPYLSENFEETSMTAIQIAAESFAKQGAPPKNGCALQANFLKNVVKEYEKAKDAVKGLPSAGQRPQLATPTRLIRAAEAQTPSGLTQDGPIALRDSGIVEPDRNHQQNHPSQARVGDHIFTDDETWEALFAQAGFSINEETFLQEPMNDNI
ncbi:hypothetical protein A1O3_08409 [Capronia epimyces CBS 606.96]|uniref:Xylanolytic transcriptional activator regulatory domain-containing protein n=1 Tax=Capronia epimyces CBS 606.96 TaxID=1182542 RepID=W9Y963_9EURO|nr:uncharacterized protein A1O3_08409 [Capronia epimyces CBS 606.96]EXJ78909.1 hypothetical protein A1O3_08409 [Capronia epimyces CBS 606.96]